MSRFIVVHVLFLLLVGSARGEVTAADSTAIQGFRKGMSLKDIAKMGYPYPERDYEVPNQYQIDDLKACGLLPTGIYRIILLVTPEDGLLQVQFGLWGREQMATSHDEALALFEETKKTLETKYSKGYSQADQLFNEGFFSKSLRLWGTSMIKDEYKHLQIEKISLAMPKDKTITYKMVYLGFSFVGHEAYMLRLKAIENAETKRRLRGF